MIKRSATLLALVLLLAAACGRGRPSAAATTPVIPTAPSATSLPEPTPLDATPPGATPTDATSPTATSPTAQPSPPATATPAPTRTGADYVLRLPREDALPADWLMNPLPDFQTRAPRPGDTYHFACRDLPARSVGAATVGYRHLDGLPSVTIEYVVYPSAAEAEAALADMREAAETCGDFTIGAGNTATTARFAPLDFATGDDGFAAALSTSNDVTGELLTHIVKVRRDHVIIGISHSAAADATPPDEALTRQLIETALDNLRDAPRPSGPSATTHALNSRKLSRIM